jgi:hypothetical protein
MSSADWIAVASAIIAFSSCIGTIISSRVQLRQIEGQAMLALRSAVEQSTASIGELFAQLAAISDEAALSKQTASDKKKLKTLELRIRTAIESKLNIYDTACTTYLENRYNKRFFKKNFYHEICGLVDSKDTWHSDCFFPEAKSKYQAILIVYKGWKHPE